ncbi:carbonic anhydrase [Legionella sp. 16cNR16C]|uniref:carbonic anhydrase n=1 Tax=Legionella sp. 16cNR16C TaxID=2905656 RepID=UPI001E448D7A|nr:carbonic anhydrase [Legionella sp. 16cNR16C]MCE3044246.1 hypothetical protein [Legionella sp. 16cNR16C]
MMRLLKLFQILNNIEQNRYSTSQPQEVNLAEEQRPEILLITCVDSRVVPELIFNAGPGKIFPVRNIANLVPADPAKSAASGIEYPLATMDSIQHVIILGHSNCGGMKGLTNPGIKDKVPSTASWLKKHAAGVIPRVSAMPGYSDLSEREKLDLIIQTNVEMQMEKLLEYPLIKAKQKEGVTVHGWVMDVGDQVISQAYDMESKQFLSRDDAEEKILNQIARQALERVTLEYIRTAVGSANAGEDIKSLMEKLKQLKINVEPIWKEIESSFKRYLMSHLHELYNGNEPVLLKLMESVPQMKLANLQAMQQEVTNSVPYQNYCAGLVRQGGFLSEHRAAYASVSMATDVVAANTGSVARL